MHIRLNGLFEDWQTQARNLIRERISPQEIQWLEIDGQQPLFSTSNSFAPVENSPRPQNVGNDHALYVPKHFLEIARTVVAYRHDKKWNLLYSVLWRIVFENHHLLKIETDDDVIQLLRMKNAVDHDVHHVHAFVRFTKFVDDAGDRYVAWYNPDHRSLRLAAPFFMDRFVSLRWSILTPDESAHWDGQQLTFTPGVPNPPPNAGDHIEELWNNYYAAIFNPARANLRMMRSEMPQRFWKHMPEVANLYQILAKAPERVEDMMALQKKMPGAAEFIPLHSNLKQLRAAIPECRGCQLYKCATQPVFGEGPALSRLVLIGEQPGDQEDLDGKPFVGPAGKVLDRALAEAGLDRSAAYVTNAVKHFAFEPRGKSRIHRTPKLSEVTTCRPWLDAEISVIKPEIVVCLGATAAKSVFGAQFRLTSDRGKFLESRFSEKTLATYHPSAVLRGATPAAKDELYRLLLTDLKTVAIAVHHKPAASA